LTTKEQIFQEAFNLPWIIPPQKEEKIECKFLEEEFLGNEPAFLSAFGPTGSLSIFPLTTSWGHWTSF